MKTILIIAALFCVYKLISAIRRRHKEKEWERQNRERQEEQARMRQEWREQQARSAAWVKEQEALYREQERQAKEQARLAKEQERQAAQLERHEEMLAKLQNKLDLAVRDIEHYSPMLEELQEQKKQLGFDIWRYEKRGLPCSAKKAEMVKLDEKIYRLETKIIKAEQTKELCESKLA